MKAVCPRLWEAEAVHDGRLDAAARASFERHMLACAACTEERAIFIRLEALGSNLDEPTVAPIERRRLRASILREANHRVLTPEPPSRLLPVLCAVLVVITAVVGGVWLNRARSARDAQRESNSPLFEITPLGAASWHIDRHDAHVEVALTDGTLAVHVEKLTSGQRFVLKVPDGDIEVRGTRFTARVDGTHTSHVAVTEGVVSLHVHDLEARELAAGTTWSATALPAGSDQDEPGKPPSGAQGAPPPLLSGEATRITLPPSPTGRRVAPLSRSTAAAPTTSSPKADVSPLDPEPAGVVFKEAMSAFSAGSYEAADVLFRSFERRFPADSRQEDVAFIRIVIGNRLGHADHAQRLARAYLAHYPTGLRRGEVESLLSTAGLSGARAPLAQ